MTLKHEPHARGELFWCDRCGFTDVIRIVDPAGLYSLRREHWHRKETGYVDSVDMQAFGDDVERELTLALQRMDALGYPPGRLATPRIGG